MPKTANSSSKRSSKTPRTAASEDNQFILVLIMGIVFCFVIVFLLWLQSVRPAEPLETYVVDAGSGYPGINLILDGVDQSGVEAEVYVVVLDKTMNTIVYERSVPVMSGSDGVFYGELTGFEDVLLNTYSILVKGPKHKQIKFDDVVFSSVGFNLTDRPLPPGDLPWDGGQDKVVNDDDYQALISRIGSTDEADLMVADLDYNGVVNEADRALMLKTLSQEL